MSFLCVSRKRSRDEDSCDFMPISKRINSLSINNPFVGDNDISSIIQQPEPNAMANHQQFAGHHNINQFNSNYNLVNGNHMMVNSNNQQGHSHQHHSHSHLGPSHVNNNYMSHGHVNYNDREPDTGGGGRHGNGGSSQQEDEDMGLECYSPELTQEENPFYYNKNKLLFDLHIERQRRHHTN